MIDSSVKRISLEMKNDMQQAYDAPTLPQGYKIVTYTPGDERRWAQIMCSVGFLENVEKAQAYFVKEFLSNPELAARQVFFVVDPNGNYVGSCSAWKVNGFNKLHWLAVLPGQQGLHLGERLVQQVLYTYSTMQVAPVYLGTQTTSHRAICLYMKSGFYPLSVLPGKTEPEADYEEALQILSKAMRPDYYEMFLRLARAD